MRSGSLSALGTSEPPIDEIGCSSSGGDAWATPTASSPNEQEPVETWLKRREEIKAQGKNGNGMGMPLTVQVRLDWPTIAASDAKKSSKMYGNGQMKLAGAVLRDWTTATARDHKNVKASKKTLERNARPPNEFVHATETTPSDKRVLNAAWVEALMGFPEGWLSGVGLPAREKRSSSGSRRGLSSPRSAPRTKRGAASSNSLRLAMPSFLRRGK